MQDAVQAGNLLHHPSSTAKQPNATETGSHPPWWVRFGIWIGLMANPQNPRPWSLNPSVVTLLIMIGGLLTGGGYYVGHQAAVIENIQKQADEAKAQSTAAQADAQKATAAVINDEGPTPTPKYDKAKKTQN